MSISGDNFNIPSEDFDAMLEEALHAQEKQANRVFFIPHPSDKNLSLKGKKIKNLSHENREEKTTLSTTSNKAATVGSCLFSILKKTGS